MANEWERAFGGAVREPEQSEWERAFGKKPELEARLYGIPPAMRKYLIKEGLKALDWEGLRDNTIKTVKETPKTIRNAKDSLNSLIYRATTPSDKLIEEAILEHLGKVGY